MVLAIPVTYAQLIRFVVFSVVVLLILAPIRLGVMEQYWSMLRGSGEAGVRPVLRWFRQGGKFGKAVVVELLLGAGVRLAGILATVPSLYLFYLFYTTTPSMAAYTTTSSLLQIGATVLAIAALVFTFWLHSIFLPVRYCLCAHPEYSLGQVFRRGLDSAKGFRGAFYPVVPGLPGDLWGHGHLRHALHLPGRDALPPGGRPGPAGGGHAPAGGTGPAPGPGVRQTGPSDRPKEKIEKIEKICLTNPPAGDIINLAL